MRRVLPASQLPLSRKPEICSVLPHPKDQRMCFLDVSGTLLYQLPKGSQNNKHFSITGKQSLSVDAMSPKADSPQSGGSDQTTTRQDEEVCCVAPPQMFHCCFETFLCVFLYMNVVIFCLFFLFIFFLIPYVNVLELLGVIAQGIFPRNHTRRSIQC